MFLYCQFKLALPCQFFGKKILIRQTKKGDREHCHKYTGAQTEKSTNVFTTRNIQRNYKKFNSQRPILFFQNNLQKTNKKLKKVTGERLQGTGYRLQRTGYKSPRPLATIRVVILKFFKTILRPWQAGVLKKGLPYNRKEQK